MKTRTATKRRRTRTRGAAVSPGAKVTLIVFGLPVAVVLLPSCIVLGICMAPTVAAYLVDRYRGKHLALTVGLLNACGSLPALAHLWSLGQSLGSVGEALADPLSWLMPYGAAGVGWFIYMSMPPVIAAYYKSASEARLRTLVIKQRQLIESWGEEVRVDLDQPAAAGGDAAPQQSAGTLGDDVIDVESVTTE